MSHRLRFLHNNGEEDNDLTWFHHERVKLPKKRITLIKI